MYRNLDNSFQSQLKLTQSNDSVNRRVSFKGSRFSRPQSPNWDTNSTNQMMYDLGLLLLHSTNSMHISLLRSLSNLYSCLHNSPKYLQHTCTSSLNQLWYIKFKPSVILLLKKNQQVVSLSDNTTFKANSPTPISWTHPTPDTETLTQPKSCSPPAPNIIPSVSLPFWPNPSLKIWPSPTLTDVNPSLTFLPGIHGRGTTSNNGTPILMTPTPTNKHSFLFCRFFCWEWI